MWKVERGEVNQTKTKYFQALTKLFLNKFKFSFSVTNNLKFLQSLFHFKTFCFVLLCCPYMLQL